MTTNDQRTTELAQEVFNLAFDLGYAEKRAEAALAEHQASSDRARELSAELYKADEALSKHLRALADKAREECNATDQG